MIGRLDLKVLIYEDDVVDLNLILLGEMLVH